MEGWASFRKLDKPVWRPMGRQLNKFRSMLFTIMKTNFWIPLSCLPSGLQSCSQAIWSFPLYKISLFGGTTNHNLSEFLEFQRLIEISAQRCQWIFSRSTWWMLIENLRFPEPWLGPTVLEECQSWQCPTDYWRSNFFISDCKTTPEVCQALWQTLKSCLHYSFFPILIFIYKRDAKKVT